MKSARKSRATDVALVKHGDGIHGKVATSVKYPGLKDLARQLHDCDEFVSHVQDWLLQKLEHPEQQFKEPFQLDELRQLDYALEGAIFQQLLRMPYWQPGMAVQPEVHLAVEDFLHTVAQTLWETLWSSEDRMPFFVTGPRNGGSKTGRKSLEGVALVGKNGRGMNTVWEHVVEFVEVQEEIGGEAGSPVSTIVGRGLFHGIHMLLSRCYSDRKPSIRRNADVAYVLFVDSRCGGVLRLKGDVTKLETDVVGLCYEAAAEWLQQHAEVAVSSVEQVWNRFGNCNWGDLGALQLILATLRCIEQCRGAPKRSLVELASDHGSRLHRRKIERRFLEIQENGMEQHGSSRGGEIQEIVDESQASVAAVASASLEPIRLEAGSVLWLETDENWQTAYRIVGSIGDEKCSVYSAVAVEDEESSSSSSREPPSLVALHIGAHPSQVEASWEEMTSWYTVQRQTRVLSLMKQRGVTSPNVTRMVAAGRMVHGGVCSRRSSSGRCEVAGCGTRVLVTCPVGDTLDAATCVPHVEVLRCCHDVLAGLRAASSAGVQHGDLAPRHVIRHRGGYVVADWGRAVVDPRDAPAMAPRYASTYALQEGRLCPASDAESVVYLVYFLAGGNMPEFDGAESALRWRERAWALRTFQLALGEVSTVLKAYADYIDSLIGTPYPADYDIWLRRLSRAIQLAESSSLASSSAAGKQRVQYIESGGSRAAAVDYNTAESSGTSGTS